MKNEPRPVKFSQIFAVDEKMYALDLNGVLWVTDLAASGHPYPADNLRWTRCAMPPEETQ